MRLVFLLTSVILIIGCSSEAHFKRNARKGDITSIILLQDIYLKSPTTKNLKKAEYWIDEGIKLDDGYSIYRKTKFLKNDTQRRELCQRASLLYIREAMYSLGWMYCDGRGGAKNVDSAIYWLGEAAKYGHPMASNDVASIYSCNIYERVNIDSAFYWYSKACYQPNKPNRYSCDKVLEFIEKGLVTNIDSVQKRIIRERLLEIKK